MKKIALIVAGGTGKRLSAEVPKQFIEICGKPVIIHTLEAFIKPLPEIQFVVAIDPKMRNRWEAVLSDYLMKNCILTEGGPERFHSVRNGLAKIPDDDTVVAIHDAVRPCVSAMVILQAFKDAEYYGNAVPALNITDSVRIKDGPLNEPVDRKRLFKIQTPQCFITRLIKKAYLQNYDERFTDDAIVLESRGERIHLIEGNAENIKITYPSDLLIAEAFLSSNSVL